MFEIKDLPPKWQLGPARQYAKGATVWDYGEAVDSFCFLRRGQVILCVTDCRGREAVLRYVRPGEPFGLTCFSEQRRASAPIKATATLASEVIAINCDDFMRFLLGRPDFMLDLLTNLSEELAYAYERSHILVNHDAEERVCALLEQLAGRLGRPSRTRVGHLNLHMTHEQLAKCAGLTRSHVSVIMARLRSKGIVRYGRSTPLAIYLNELQTWRTARAPRTKSVRG